MRNESNHLYHFYITDLFQLLVRKEEQKMRKKDYVKLTVFSTNDDDLLFNVFPIYVAVVMILFNFAILQGELNVLSVTLFIGSTIVACRAAYLSGKNSKQEEWL